MLAIGAVIGAGIFGAIGTAAAGQTGPNGEVIRYGAGPALVFSFVLLGGVCALAALCYAELASMIPQAGSAYAYSYATLGELVAWIIGWDLILEYAVGNVAVAISWGDYFKSLIGGVGLGAAGLADDGLSDSAPELQSRRARPAADGAAALRCPDSRQPAGVRHRDGRHVAAAARGARELDREQRDGRGQARGAGAVHRRRADQHRHGATTRRSRRTALPAFIRARRSSSSPTSGSTRSRRRPRRRTTLSETCRSASSADSRSAR